MGNDCRKAVAVIVIQKKKRLDTFSFYSNTNNIHFSEYERGCLNHLDKNTEGLDKFGTFLFLFARREGVSACLDLYWRTSSAH